MRVVYMYISFKKTTNYGICHRKKTYSPRSTNEQYILLSIWQDLFKFSTAVSFVILVSNSKIYCKNSNIKHLQYAGPKMQNKFFFPIRLHTCLHTLFSSRWTINITSCLNLQLDFDSSVCCICFFDLSK